MTSLIPEIKVSAKIVEATIKQIEIECELEIGDKIKTDVIISDVNIPFENIFD